MKTLALFILFLSSNIYALNGGKIATEADNYSNHMLATGQILRYQISQGKIETEKDFLIIRKKCSGVFVSPSIFLSAAHCFVKKEKHCVITTKIHTRHLMEQEDRRGHPSPLSIKESAVSSGDCIPVRPIAKHYDYLYKSKDDGGFTRSDIAAYEVINKKHLMENFVPITKEKPQDDSLVLYVGYAGNTKTFGNNLLKKIKGRNLITYSRLTDYGYPRDIPNNVMPADGDSGGPVFDEAGSSVLSLIKGTANWYIDFLIFKKMWAHTYSELLSSSDNIDFLYRLIDQGHDIRFVER